MINELKFDTCTNTHTHTHTTHIRLFIFFPKLLMLLFEKEYGTGVPVSPHGDIYSFGILLLEMLTGKRPTDNMFSESLSLHEFCKMKIPEGILEIVDSHLLLPFAEDDTGIVENKIRNCLVMFAAIGVACSEESPAHRMLIKDAIANLNEIKSMFP
ncbi:putative non-specific serine/threonine protein kinase [Medicago truncatula]|uniref:Putative non-specific serine/threonine protein kinase n=1 Tax=Medicago truncatula TaxID=3880 RepID=A0A396HUX3_MEDTR|nr:putative non-specific serine/threonine protein kinase [Medicago truncatula]